MAAAELNQSVRTRRRGWRRRLAQLASVYALLWAATALAALAVALLPALRSLVAAAVPLDLHPHADASAGNVLRLVRANAWAAWPLAAATLGAARIAGMRVAVDVALCTQLAFNAALVGAAIGVHGLALARWLPHLPFEWAALAVAGAGWLQARRGARSRPIVQSIALYLVLLVIAAALETYAVPHT
jgi:hypothetical protein